jgi:glycosyltransferase involved in cell wall biosynthesis
VDLGLADRIDWLGARAQDDVFAAYGAADLFVLASRVAEDGDRDGLPNVLMEAQALGLACVSTAVSAIPELIRDGETGLLVPPEDPGALAEALGALAADPARRAAVAAAGRARVLAHFTFAGGVGRLAERFGIGTAP